MKEISLNLWWSSGMDGDGYESSYRLSDKNFAKIVSLVRRYAKQNSEDGSTYIDPEDFDTYFANTTPALYQQISAKVRSYLTATAVQTAKDWFDEEAEGCTVEEYLDSVYVCGFYLKEEFLTQCIKE